MPLAPDQQPKALRCRACQLQLCKGRGEPPHAALTQTGHDEMMPHATRYKCETCGAILVRSQDYATPGWSHRR